MHSSCVNVTKCLRYQCQHQAVPYLVTQSHMTVHQLPHHKLSYLLGVLLVYGFLSLFSDPVLVTGNMLLCAAGWSGDDVSREMESRRLNNLRMDTTHNYTSQLDDRLEHHRHFSVKNIIVSAARRHVFKTNSIASIQEIKLHVITHS